MDVLEGLCKKFARERNIELKTEGTDLSGQQNGLTVKLMRSPGTLDLFGVEKKSECTLVLAYCNVPGQEEKTAYMSLSAGCFRDYLTLLARTKSSFAQIARERFEPYLNQPIEGTYEEVFDEVNAMDLLPVLNSFYPKQN